MGKEKMKIELVKADSNEFLNVTDATNAMERLMTRTRWILWSAVSGPRPSWPCRTSPWITKKFLSAAGAAHPELCTAGGQRL